MAVSLCLAPVAIAPVAMVPKQFHYDFPQLLAYGIHQQAGPRNPLMQTRKKAGNRNDERVREVIKQTHRKWRWKTFGVRPRNSFFFFNLFEM